MLSGVQVDMRRSTSHVKVNNSSNYNIGKDDIEKQPLTGSSSSSSSSSNSISDDHTISNKSSSSSSSPSLTYSILHKVLVERLSNIKINARGTTLLSGVDRVLSGVSPAAECVLLCGVQPPRYLWYMLSGFGCDVLQFGTNVVLHRVILVRDNTWCWTMSFVVSIVFRHSAHRYFTFGNYVGGYWNSLLRMYGGYSFSIVLSTLFNWGVSRSFRSGRYSTSNTNSTSTTGREADFYIAYFCTMLWTGVVNYFILKKIWNFAGEKRGGATSSSSSSAVVGVVTSASRCDNV